MSPAARNCVMVVVLVSACTAGVMCEESEPTENYISKLFGDDDGAVAARTFGHHALKRLAFIFLPVMFTLGVISTLLLGLSVLAVKNLAVGIVLLIVGVSQAISRVLYPVPAPAPLLHYGHLHSRAEPSFAAPWPLPAPAAPLLSPWARSDDAGPDVQH